MISTALVLAGGLGTRLRSRVPHLPKPMAPVAGRPFLEYLLDRLVRDGMRDIILSVGYRAAAIRAHFGTGYRGAALRYAIEPEPLGTGGAIAFGLRGEEDRPLLVINGDTLLDLNYRALIDWYRKDPVSVAMVLRKVPDTSRYGAAIVDAERVTAVCEEGTTGPGLINAGIYVLQPGVLERFMLPEKFSFETDFLRRYCRDLRPRAWLSDAYFIDIGVPGDFDRAQQELPGLRD